MMGTFFMENFDFGLHLRSETSFQTKLEFEKLGVDIGAQSSTAQSSTVQSSLTIVENSIGFSLGLISEFSFSGLPDFSMGGPTFTAKSETSAFSNGWMETSTRVSKSEFEWSALGFQIEAKTMRTSSEISLPRSIVPAMSEEQATGETKFAILSENERSVAVKGPGWQWTQAKRKVEFDFNGSRVQSSSDSTELEIGNGWLRSTQSHSISLEYQESIPRTGQQLERLSEKTDVAMGPFQLSLEASRTNSIMSMSQPTVLGHSLEFEKHATNWSLSLV